MWSDWLVFYDYGFNVSAVWCPLAIPTVLLGFLLPWTWGLSSLHFQQSAATAPYLGWQVTPHALPDIYLYIMHLNIHICVFMHVHINLYNIYRNIIVVSQGQNDRKKKKNERKKEIKKKQVGPWKQELKNTHPYNSFPFPMYKLSPLQHNREKVFSCLFPYSVYVTEYMWLWRRKWQPTPVFLPGESHGQRSLVGCSPWGRTESNTTEATWQYVTHPISKWPTRPLSHSLDPGCKNELRTPVHCWPSLDTAHCSNSISHYNKLHFPLILSHVWKFFSNPWTDHDNNF